MLVLRYFMYVGGTLLALLLLCAAVLPKPPVDDTVASASDVPSIRIHSQQKWPERVVLDTNAQMPAPVNVVQAVAPAEQSASAKARVREAFAQLPADQAKEQAVADVKKAEPKPPVKRRVARARPAPQPYYQQGYYGYPPQYYPQGRMQVAQQPRFGFLW
ncbi:hypothetical protein [Bradyrhizobium sp. Tv2a-2]|uniref:hypothetical protein n=1 Tax=Bradyrhizobium sp. Tv2a-2 TaxID=113395 RepID=UPI0003F9730C|nr:hypothetical protein [Bradyrhizobium sp. Tv2a-2]